MAWQYLVTDFPYVFLSPCDNSKLHFLAGKSGWNTSQNSHWWPGSEAEVTSLKGRKTQKRRGETKECLHLYLVSLRLCFWLSCLSVFEMTMVLFDNAKPFSFLPKSNQVHNSMYDAICVAEDSLWMAEMDGPCRSVSLPHVKFHWNIRHGRRRTPVRANHTNVQK